jgi:hypothetical protein avisC_05318
VEAFEKVETLVRAWLEEERITRVDVYLNGLGAVEDTRCRRTADGERRSVRIDGSAGSAVNELRGMQALPGRGAWFYSHLWMEMPEGVLHQESDWMCEPDMGFDEVPLGAYKTELDRYPRDQEFIPDWLRDKVERWRLERGPVVARRVAHLEEEFRLEGGKYLYP